MPTEKMPPIAEIDPFLVMIDYQIGFYPASDSDINQSPQLIFMLFF